MGFMGQWTRVWLLAAASIAVCASSARADDFDDDFAEEPAAPARGSAAQAEAPAPSPAPDGDFDDDFASAPRKAPKAEPAQEVEAEAEAGFDEDFAAASNSAGPADDAATTTTGATTAGTELPEGARRVECAVVDAAMAKAGDPEARERRRRALRTFSTQLGPTGGIHVADAGGGADKSFRLSLGTQFFHKDGFLVADDDASRIGGHLAFAITPRPYLEIAASVVAYASANAQEDPDLFQVLGDMRVFGRGFHRVLPWLTVGGDLELAFLNGVGGIGLSGKGTSVGLRGNVSADLRELDRKNGKELPLILRTNLRYYFDNSGKLVADTERARYANLAAPLSMGDETRHLATNVERYAFDVNRVDSFTLAFGIEAPLHLKDDYYLHPLIEWSVDIPVNRQGYDCVYRPLDPSERDSCLAEEGFSARTSTLTLGARFVPPVQGFSVMTAFDIATSGSRTTVRELAPNSSWMWLLGFTYAYDLKPPPAEVYSRTVIVQPEPEAKPLGRLRGRVIEVDSKAPVPGVVVRFEGDEDRSALLTDAAGEFISYALEPGPVVAMLEAEDYAPSRCEGTLPEDGGDVSLTCELKATRTDGALRVSVRDQSGAGIANITVRTVGTGEPLAAITNSRGEALFEDVPQGRYDVQAESKQFLSRRASVSVQPRATATATLSLTAVPEKSGLRTSRKRIVPRRRLHFVGDGNEIDADSHVTLAEVADYLLRHPELRVVEVQRHSDNAGGPEAAKNRSEGQAAAIRDWLVGAGVASGRLRIHGLGASRPVAPNITPQNRARNRRTVFEVVERD